MSVEESQKIAKELTRFSQPRLESMSKTVESYQALIQKLANELKDEKKQPK